VGPPILRLVDLILIPGLWLDGSSWDAVVPPLQQAGHRTHALTLPGMASREADRSCITLRAHVDAVVDAIDSLCGAGNDVALVGHSGGGAIAHAAVDARPDRVARVVYVDAGPLGDGGVINDELPVENGEVPLPDWSLFSEEDLIDLDDGLRAAFRARAVPSPAHVATDAQRLVDDRRYDVPVTVIACEFPSAQLREWIEQGNPYVQELARVHSVELVDLPTGHWPQFTRPTELARAILDAVGPA
jgi:pimeloyl-ACP methyl ester carboxylesterase